MYCSKKISNAQMILKFLHKIIIVTTQSMQSNSQLKVNSNRQISTNQHFKSKKGISSLLYDLFYAY